MTKDVTMSTTKLASNGRVVIPAEVREILGLTAGEEFEVVVENREIRLIPRSSIVEFVMDHLQSTVGERSLVDELIDDRRREA
jgi:AbrB family looped-hinge helix DNA binding protein